MALTYHNTSAIEVLLLVNFSLRLEVQAVTMAEVSKEVSEEVCSSRLSSSAALLISTLKCSPSR